MKTDTLNRRSRFAPPQPVDAAIILQERDYLIFETLDRHGKLPTPYLHEFTKHAGKNYKHLQLRLTQLYNGYCDELGHRAQIASHVCKPTSYLARDLQQFNNFQARYQPAVYGIAPAAKHLLLAAGRGTTHSPVRNDPFVHQLFGACFSASIERAAKPHRFITGEEILQHAKCPESTRMAPNPFAIPVSDPDIKHIIPDNLFGIEYDRGGFRFFAVEIDRNTESINPRKPVKNSIAKKVKGYSDVFANRTFASHLGLPNLTVLIPTTNVTHMRRMIEYVQEDVEPRYRGRFLFQAFPDFGEVWRVPRDMLDVVKPWASAAGEVDIMRKASA